MTGVIIPYHLDFLEPFNFFLFMYFCVNLMKEFKILLFYFKNMFILMFVDFCKKEWKRRKITSCSPESLVQLAGRTRQLPRLTSLVRKAC